MSVSLVQAFPLAASPALPATLRPAGLDDIPAIRFVHHAALSACLTRQLGVEDVAAAVRFVHEPDYCARLAEARLVAAWVEDLLVGTIGWVAENDGQPYARLHMCYVWPLFARAGIGRALIEKAEVDVYQAGYRRIRLRTPSPAAAFFRRMGYALTSHGRMRLPGGVEVPAAFMRKDRLIPVSALAGLPHYLSGPVRRH